MALTSRKAILTIALLSIVLQILYAFSESSITLFYIVAGVDALTVSLLIGLLGALLSIMIKEA